MSGIDDIGKIEAILVQAANQSARSFEQIVFGLRGKLDGGMMFIESNPHSPSAPWFERYSGQTNMTLTAMNEVTYDVLEITPNGAFLDRDFEAQEDQREYIIPEPEYEHSKEPEYEHSRLSEHYPRGRFLETRLDQDNVMNYQLGELKIEN